MSEQRKLNPNSALHWWPRLEEVQDQLLANLPETKLVEYDTWGAVATVDGEADDLPWQEFQEAAVSIDHPVFVRTDLASAKHHGEDAFVSDTIDELRGVIIRTLDYTMSNGLLSSALMLREHIRLETRFKAFGGTPIAREYRVFANPERVLCTHFYWPENSINQPDKDDWRDRLDYLDQRTAKDASIMEHDAKIASAAAGEGEPWSVDFAMDWLGDWWLIDMARAEDSWHPDDCPNASDTST